MASRERQRLENALARRLTRPLVTLIVKHVFFPAALAGNHPFARAGFNGDFSRNSIAARLRARNPLTWRQDRGDSRRGRSAFPRQSPASFGIDPLESSGATSRRLAA